MLSHLVTSVWEKTKIANSYVDIWWCPWDKGGAVIYVIGGTHPPIWLAIDINHHQISNGHAFPSAIKCAHSVWHKSKTSFSVCLFLSVCACVCVCVSERSGWFGEADERQFVAEEGEVGGSCLSSMAVETSNGRRVVESQDLVTRHGNDARENQWREKTAMILIWHWLCFGNNGGEAELWAHLNNLWIHKSDQLTMHYPPLNKMKIYVLRSNQIDQNSPTLVLRLNRIFKIRWHGKWALRYRGICLPNWVQMLRGRWRGKICLPGLVRPTDWTFRGVGKIFGEKTWSEMKHVRDHSSLDHYFFHLGVGFLKGFKNCLIFQFSKHPSFSPFDRGATKWLPAIPICGPLESSQYLRKPVY